MLSLLACCGDPKPPGVTDLVDRIRASGRAPRHAIVPSPARYEELLGEPRDDPAGLRPGPVMAELIERGEAAVPALCAMLEDRDRSVVAAYALAEIGGEQAAHALWQAFLRLSPDTVRMRAYRHGRVTEGNAVVFAEGEFYEGPDPDLYAELAFGALCHAGEPIVAEIIAFTREAMDRTHALHAEETRLSHEREVLRDGERYTESWQTRALEHSLHGLWILGHLGDARAAGVFGIALRSPVQAIRVAAIENAAWLCADVTLEALGSNLEDTTRWVRDQRICDLALESIAFVMHRRTVRTDTMSLRDRDQMIEVYRMRLQRGDR